MRKAYDRWMVSLMTHLLNWAKNDSDISYAEYQHIKQTFDNVMAEREEALKGTRDGAST
jgi:hypothetical protein